MRHSVHNLLTSSVHNLMTLTAHEVLTLYTNYADNQYQQPLFRSIPARQNYRFTIPCHDASK